LFSSHLGETLKSKGKWKHNEIETYENMQKEKKEKAKRLVIFWLKSETRKHETKNFVFSLRRKTGRLEAINFVISSLTCQVLSLAPALHERIQRNIT
jgi:hypothetical protein